MRNMDDRRRQWIAAALMALVVLMAAAPLHAETDIDNKSITDGDNRGPGDGVWAWVQMLVALGVIVGLIFLARYLLRRFGLARSVLGGSDLLNVVARAPLTPRHQLYLLHMGRRLVLIGAGAEGLATLAEVTDPDEIGELLTAAKAGPGSLTKTLQPKANQTNEDETE